MAERLGEGYIEIFGLDAKFNASLRQVQKQLDSTIARAKTAQGAVASASGFGSRGIADARRAMGMGSGGYAINRSPGMLSGPGVGGGYSAGGAAAQNLTGGYALAAGYGPAGAATGHVPPGGYALGRGFGPAGAPTGYGGPGGGPVVPPTVAGKMGIFGPGMTVGQAQRYSKMAHPTIPGLNALGQPMAGAAAAATAAATAAGGAGSGAAKAEIDTVHGAYKALMGLYAARVVGGVFVDSVQHGSDMIETLQKTREVFGAATGTVTNMVDDMAKRFGSNKQVMLDTASVFGLIGQAAKMPEAESARMAVAMSRLAADASSFYNVPLDAALTKIQAGLVGQSRPLREFGVLLNIATVKAKAAEMGFKTLNGQFSEPDKIMARMQLIKEGLSKASGDVERTIDSPANVQRRLEGELENLKTEQGMPIAAAAAAMLTRGRENANAKGPFSGGVRGWLIGAVEEAFLPNEKKMNSMMGVDSRMITRAEIKPPESPMEKFFREREAHDQAMSNMDRQNRAHKGGFGAFGMFGDMSSIMMSGAEDAISDVNKKINKVQRGEDAWGGGHVTDPLSFMRAAQEKILTPMDETAKEQLAELKAIREAIESQGVHEVGMVLRGREN